MPKFITNILNLLPAIIGVAQGVLPLIKEVAVAIARIIALLPFLWSSDTVAIEKINDVYDIINEWVEKIKNAVLLFK